jgi:hypothetical protein
MTARRLVKPHVDSSLINVRVRDVAPGVWEDGNGHLHFSIPEIHDFLGLPSTPNEIEDTRANLRLYFAPLFEHAEKCGAKIIVREHP